MTTRACRRACELIPGQYVVDDGVLHRLAFVQTHGTSTLLVFPNNWAIAGGSDRLIELATAEEVFTAADAAALSGRGLENFPGMTHRPDSVEQVFGPMYADPSGCERCGALAQVPGGIGLCADCQPLLPLGRDGFAPPSGHAAVLPPDALKHDRYNGENES